MARQLRMAAKTLALAAFIGATLLWQGSGTATATWATAVTASGYHACTLATVGGVKCWGYNSNAQLGVGTVGGHRLDPVDVVGLTSGVASVDAGRLHTCAVTTGGGLKCWGYNFVGQVGDGQACGSYCTSPAGVTGLGSGVAAVAGGGEHTCALTTTGGVKCWGANNMGGLGDGQSCGSICTTPVDVSGLGSGVAGITAGEGHTCAVMTEGGVMCWGYNDGGQVGDGTYTDRNTPVDVDVFGLGPKPVGGIAEAPVVEGAPSGRGGSTGTSASLAALAGGAVAAGLAALASVAWYARRRRLRG